MRNPLSITRHCLPVLTVGFSGAASEGGHSSRAGLALGVHRASVSLQRQYWYTRSIQEQCLWDLYGPALNTVGFPKMWNPQGLEQWMTWDQSWSQSTGFCREDRRDLMTPAFSMLSAFQGLSPKTGWPSSYCVTTFKLSPVLQQQLFRVHGRGLLRF